MEQGQVLPATLEDAEPRLARPGNVAEAVDGVDVLVVDDDERNLRAAQALLAGRGTNVVLARSGEEALRALLGRDFAVIVLDVQMPGLSGLETAALIRDRERSRRTPIIFLTAHNRTQEQVLAGYRLGAVDFLTKPILPEEILREKVSWFVEAQRAAALLDRERERARAAERREHERAVAEAKRRGEADALRAEMERQKELLERVNRANGRLRVLSSVTNELLVGAAPLEVLPRLFAALSDHLRLEVYLLHLCDERDALRLESHGGIAPAVAADLSRLPQERLVFTRAARARRPVIVEEVLRTDEPVPALRLLQLTAAACFPLVAQQRLIGTLTFGTRERPRFDADELAALELTADQVAMALERARLIEELRNRAEDLAEADRRKDEFLAMLAHELRNPLAPIVNAVQILRQEEAPAGARHRALDAADRQARHIARLVDDLVDVSRIRTGKVELRRARVDLARVIEDAVAAVDPLVKEQRQELRVELPPEPVAVDGDPVRLTQVVENLLHNSAKYTDPGGHILLVARRDGAEVVVRITDDGIGIPPDLMPRIFDTFVQGKQPAHRARGGLGLGLTLVRSLAELHGGTVRVSSPGAGMGATFEVRLPAAREPAPAADVRPTSSLRPLRIAVVEDNPDIRDTLQELLQLRGHEVAIAEDGALGVELLLARRPDVALVDIGLPGLSGYEVAAQVRAAGVSDTRLVALTGYSGAEERKRAQESGFDAHLVKPVELDELTRVLQALFP